MKKNNIMWIWSYGIEFCIQTNNNTKQNIVFILSILSVVKDRKLRKKKNLYRPFSKKKVR